MEPSKEEKSSIERLKKKLYTRSEEGLAVRGRRALREQYYDVGEGWASHNEPPPPSAVKRSSVLSTVFIAAIVFFILSVGISIFLFFGGGNLVSSENVDIEIAGPIAIPGGEELVLAISIVNRNSVAIESADLLVEYPPGTRSASDVTLELPRVREALGTIASGEEVNRTVRAVLFGQESDEQEIKLTIEYRVKDSNATFYKEAVHRVLLSSAPLTLKVTALSEVISGQPVEFVVDVTSNSTSVIHDVLLKTEYPFGFEFNSASPKPLYDTTVWKLGDIPPGATQRVTIRGIMVGQDEEERVFRFRAGTESERNERDISVALGSSNLSLVIKRPFIGIALALNGQSGADYVARAGEQVRADLALTNNLPTQVSDVEVSVKINGTIVNEFSITAPNGFYDSSIDTINWNKSTYPTLASMSPGDENRVAFSLGSFGLPASASYRNPVILLAITVRGRRVSERGVPEVIESTLSRSVKVASDLSLSSRVLYSTGPFTNTGPLPPKAEHETTYTVLWVITNSSNQVTDAKVVAAIPSYVRFVGAVSPSGEDVVYNPVGGTVTWRAGSIPAGTGFGSAAREMAFQIALFPSLSQINSAPNLIGEQTLTGIDRFTGTEVRSSRRELTTRLSTDPGVPDIHSEVVP